MQTTVSEAAEAGWAENQWRRMITPVALALLISAGATPAAAAGPAAKQPHAQPSSAARPSRPPTPLPEPDRSLPLAQQYCEAIRDKVAEARFAFQAAHLDALSKQVEETIGRLDARAAELRQWIAKRDAFSQQATAHLVGIFGSMRPASAADQLVKLNQTTAAAIVSKLEQREASAILNEMPPERAARLVSIIAEAAKRSDSEGSR